MTDQKSSTAVMVVDPSAIEYPLDDFPEDRFNRLIPTETIQIPTDLLVPVVQVVRLSEADIYHSNDMKQGQSAPNRAGLRKLATAAGISTIDERRVDDGSKPGVCGVQVTAEMLLPTGARIRGTGSRWIDLDRMSWSSDAQKGKFRGFLYEHTASRAENRAIRSLLSLRGSYPDAELRKPFAVVSFVPNMNHPEIRARILDTLAPAIAAGFGPAAKQLAPGAIQQVPEAAEDDVVEGSFTDRSSPSDAAVSDGPVASEPDWFSSLQTTPPATAGPSKLVEVLRDKAEHSGLAGPITDAQKPQVMAALGNDVELLRAGLRAVWDVQADEAGRLPVTAAQAQAILNAARDDSFLDMWREAFGQAAAA